MATITDLPSTCKLLKDPGYGGYRGRFDASGRKHMLHYVVDWEQHEDAIQTFAGKPQIFGSGANGQVVRRVPMQSPYVPNMWATSCEHSTRGADRDVDEARPWTKVFLDVEFGTLPFVVEGTNAFTSVRIRGSTEMLTLPGVPFSFTSPLEYLEQDIGRQIGLISVDVTRHWVPDIDAALATLLPVTGCVNLVPLVIGATSFPAGTVLLPTFEVQNQQTVGAGPQQEVSYSLQWRSLNWQWAMRKDGTYAALTPSPYPTADLTPILSI